MARTSAHSLSSITSNKVLKTSRVAHAAHVNVSQETRKFNTSAHDQIDGEDQSRYHSPLRTLQFQIAKGFQQPLRFNRNAEH